MTLDLDNPPDSTWDVLPPEQELAAAKGRAAFWNSSLKPYNPHEVHLIDQVAIQSVRVDRCQHQERAIRRLHAKRAKLRWAEDRRNAAEALGAKLAHHPALVARKLDATAQGCDWLIGRWEGLGRALRDDGHWGDPQRKLALDLLGIPAEFRAGKTTAADGDPATLAELARGEVERLRALKSRAMVELDDDEREMACQGFGPDHDGALAALRRFERSCSRRLEWSRNQLRSYRKNPMPDGSGPDEGKGSYHNRPLPDARPAAEDRGGRSRHPPGPRSRPQGRRPGARTRRGARDGDPAARGPPPRPGVRDPAPRRRPRGPAARQPSRPPRPEGPSPPRRLSVRLATPPQPATFPKQVPAKSAHLADLDAGPFPIRLKLCDNPARRASTPNRGQTRRPVLVAGPISGARRGR